MEISISGVSLSVMACYTPYGFPCWEIFDQPVTAEDFVAFVQNKVSQFVTEDSFAIVDNATNQKTEECTEALDQTFRGKYMYCFKYSCDLKPIESGFANIKKWIRAHEDEGVGNPKALLHFELYSPWGARGCTG